MLPAHIGDADVANGSEFCAADDSGCGPLIAGPWHLQSHCGIGASTPRSSHLAAFLGLSEDVGGRLAIKAAWLHNACNEFTETELWRQGHRFIQRHALERFLGERRFLAHRREACGRS
mmetsp:Transcript_45409/g.104914  ORF Transcript_45409/g.104914 Transcript_45409/m.104914 type:complete len:118 (-) Transcript_45409:351-704(-)